MIPDAFLALLQQLNTTYSPDKKLNFLLEFLIEQEVDMKEPKIKEIIDQYRKVALAKTQAGSQGGKTTSFTKANVKHKNNKETILEHQNTGWLFLTKSPRMDYCEGKGCKERYHADDPIFYRKETKQGFHPNCAPPEIKEELKLTSKYYQNYLKKNGQLL